MSGGQLDASVEAIPFNADFGVIYNGGGGQSGIFYATTEYWDSQTELVPKEGHVYLYSDYKQDYEGNNVVGIKVGDGVTLLSELTFTDALTPTKTSQLENDRQYMSGKKKSGTLHAGETQITFTDESITANSDIMVMADVWYKGIVTEDGECTITFPVQAVDLPVKIVIIM